MNKKIIIFFIIISSFNSIYTQTFNKFGIKSGLIFNGISTQNDGASIVEESAIFNYLSYDFGLFGEFFNSKKFCISTELHFTAKGEKNAAYVIITKNTTQGQIYDFEYLSDRFYYISLHTLPKYRFFHSSRNENLYVMAGPKFDFLISNSNSDNYENSLKIKNSNLEVGALIGFGIEVWDIVSFEFRFEHTFTPVYKLSYNNGNITRHHNALVFLTGLNLKKVLKF
jgi:hypothetical protein